MTRRNEWTPEAIARFWDHLATTSETEYFTAEFGSAIVAFLDRRGVLESGTAVLDYGCGRGNLVPHLLGAGLQVAGIDQSEGSVELVNERFAGKKGWLGATTDLPDRTFDLATCIETIEHLDDEALSVVLGHLRRLITRTGTVVFTTPNDEQLEDSFVYCPFCDTEFHSVQHVRSFSRESLSAVLVDHGFEVITCEATNLGRYTPLRFHDRYPRTMLLHWRERVMAKGFGRFDGDGPHLVAIARPATEARRFTRP